MEADDFYVVVVENDETGVTGPELKLTVIDVSDEVPENNDRESISKTDNNVYLSERRDIIDTSESILGQIEKEDMKMLFEVIDDNISVQLQELSSQNCNAISEENVIDNISVKLEELPEADRNEFLERNEIEFRDKFFTSLLQIECPRKRKKRIFDFFKDTLLKNERRVVEPLDITQYSYYGDDNYMCKYCDHFTSHETTAIKHYRFRHGPRIYLCLACKVAYRRHDSLIRHERLCVSEYAEILRKARQYIGPRLAIRSKNKKMKKPCPLCGKLIPRGSIRKHLDIHAGVYHECDECGSRFLSKNSLIQHLSTHRTQTLYQCDQCDRAYTSVRGLKRHEMDHVSEAYICDICGRNFLRQGSLHQHIKINHTDHTYILCQLCGKSYKQKNSFRRHQCAPWKNVPMYQCMKCNKRFLKESIFKRHLNKKHGLDTSNLLLDSSKIAEEGAMYTIANTTLRKLKEKMTLDKEDFDMLIIADE